MCQSISGRKGLHCLLVPVGVRRLLVRTVSGSRLESPVRELDMKLNVVEDGVLVDFWVGSGGCLAKVAL